MRAGQGRFLRNTRDRRSLLFVALALALLLAPLALPPPAWLLPFWLLASTLLCFSACIINHNHVHLPVFHQAFLNHLFAALLGLARGHTSYGVIVAHNLNHHRHNGGDGDWIHTRLAGEHRGLRRLARYIVRATLSMARGRADPRAPRLSASQHRQLHLQRFLLAVFVAAMFHLAGAAVLLYLFLPWGLAIAMLVGVNLLQHDACDPQSRLDHSRNFLGRVGNWLFFNNGYHAIHHMEPELHWSRLPGAHARRVAGQADPALQVQSILGFLWRHYLAPGACPVQEKAIMAGK